MTVAAMASARSALPQLAWRTVHVASGLALPLLPDEEEAIESAAIALLDAPAAGAGGEGQMIFDMKLLKLAPGKPPPVALEPSAARAAVRDETEEEEIEDVEGDVFTIKSEKAYLEAGAPDALHAASLERMGCVAPGRTTKTASPSIEDVERLHEQVYGRLKAVYDAQKAFAGYGDRELVVS